MDKYIFDFIANNWFTMYIGIKVLQGIAILTPSVKDDKVVTLLSQVYDTLRGGKVPDQLTEETK